MATEDISGLDDLSYDVTLTDRNGVPVTSGTVVMSLCTYGTADPLGGLAVASQTLNHVGSGRWTATHDLANVATAIASVTVGGLFSRCLTAAGLATRTMATCRRVRIVDGNGPGNA
jgi:hypothetical protein